MNTVVNGIDIFYEVRGKGPAMVLVHGNSEDHHTFDSTAAILEEYFTLYLMDSRGHGRSGHVDEFHYADMAEDVFGLIEALGIEKPIVVGFSDGGIIGLTLAFTHPDSLSALVACGPNSRPDALRGIFGWQCRNNRKLRRDPRVIMMLEEPHITEEQLASIRVPTYILAGSKDCIDPDDIDFIASHIPGAQKVIVEGEGHGTYIEDSDKLANMVLGWFGPQ